MSSNRLFARSTSTLAAAASATSSSTSSTAPVQETILTQPMTTERSGKDEASDSDVQPNKVTKKRKNPNVDDDKDDAIQQARVASRHSYEQEQIRAQSTSDYSSSSSSSSSSSTRDPSASTLNDNMVIETRIKKEPLDPQAVDLDALLTQYLDKTLDTEKNDNLTLDELYLKLASFTPEPGRVYDLDDILAHKSLATDGAVQPIKLVRTNFHAYLQYLCVSFNNFATAAISAERLDTVAALAAILKNPNFTDYTQVSAAIEQLKGTLAIENSDLAGLVRMHDLIHQIYHPRINNKLSELSDAASIKICKKLTRGILLLYVDQVIEQYAIPVLIHPSTEETLLAEPAWSRLIFDGGRATQNEQMLSDTQLVARLQTQAILNLIDDAAHNLSHTENSAYGIAQAKNKVSQAIQALCTIDPNAIDLHAQIHHGWTLRTFPYFQRLRVLDSILFTPPEQSAQTENQQRDSLSILQSLFFSIDALTLMYYCKEYNNIPLDHPNWIIYNLEILSGLLYYSTQLLNCSHDILESFPVKNGALFSAIKKLVEHIPAAERSFAHSTITIIHYFLNLTRAFLSAPRQEITDTRTNFEFYFWLAKDFSEDNVDNRMAIQLHHSIPEAIRPMIWLSLNLNCQLATDKINYFNFIINILTTHFNSKLQFLCQSNVIALLNASFEVTCIKMLEDHLVLSSFMPAQISKFISTYATVLSDLPLHPKPEEEKGRIFESERLRMAICNLTEKLTNVGRVMFLQKILPKLFNAPHIFHYLIKGSYKAIFITALQQFGPDLDLYIHELLLRDYMLETNTAFKLGAYIYLDQDTQNFLPSACRIIGRSTRIEPAIKKEFCKLFLYNYDSFFGVVENKHKEVILLHNIVRDSGLNVVEFWANCEYSWYFFFSKSNFSAPNQFFPASIYSEIINGVVNGLAKDFSTAEKQAILKFVLSFSTELSADIERLAAAGILLSTFFEKAVAEYSNCSFSTPYLYTGFNLCMSLGCNINCETVLAFLDEQHAEFKQLITQETSRQPDIANVFLKTFTQYSTDLNKSLEKLAKVGIHLPAENSSEWRYIFERLLLNKNVTTAANFFRQHKERFLGYAKEHAIITANNYDLSPLLYTVFAYLPAEIEMPPLRQKKFLSAAQFIDRIQGFGPENLACLTLEEAEACLKKCNRPWAENLREQARLRLSELKKRAVSTALISNSIFNSSSSSALPSINTLINMEAKHETSSTTLTPARRR